MKYHPEGKRIFSPENQAALATPSSLAEACRAETILESRAVLCTSRHDLIVQLPCMKGVIPRDEGALGIREGTVRDIAIISRVNRPVCFVVEGFSTDEDGHPTAVLSRRKAQEICRDRYIRRLCPGDVVEACVTHLEPFGAFCDIGCGIVSLLPIDAISVSRIQHPRERFSAGMMIRAVVRSVDNDRITLSHKELLGTWEENAAAFHMGETVRGVIRSVEPYGIFVELAPNLSGLAELRAGAVPGRLVSVFIKNILPDRMKIKLIIIDQFDEVLQPQAPVYFTQAEHIETFAYSPPGCVKEITRRYPPRPQEAFPAADAVRPNDTP